jgi:serine/threonine-protein kinase
VSRAPLRLRPGQTVSRGAGYEIVEVLGEGGMGKVYKAYDPQLDRYVALKILKPDVPEQERERFAREARLAANFSHPNLVRALDAGVLADGKSHWMALEHLRGQDLAGMLEGQPRLAPAILVDVFRQVLDALEYVHARGIVHCDVTPENIFLTRDPLDRRLPLVKLIDFGIHRDLRPPIELRRRLSGDPRYMAPEQAVLNGRLDGGADLYALGITLYEAATGAHPFADLLAGPVDALLAAHGQRPLPTVLGRLPGGVSRPFGQGLDALVRKACAKGREERFGSAGDMRRAVVRLGDLATLRTAA